MRELTVNWLSVLADKALDAIEMLALGAHAGPCPRFAGCGPGRPGGPALAFGVLLTTTGRCWRVVCVAGAQGGDRGRSVIVGMDALQPIPAQHRSPAAGDLEEGFGERRGMGCPAAAQTPVTSLVFAVLSLCNRLSRSPCPSRGRLHGRVTDMRRKKTPLIAASTPGGNTASARCRSAPLAHFPGPVVVGCTVPVAKM